jgi:hypothetical protein
VGAAELSFPVERALCLSLSLADRKGEKGRVGVYQEVLGRRQPVGRVLTGRIRLGKLLVKEAFGKP